MQALFFFNDKVDTRSMITDIAMKVKFFCKIEMEGKKKELCKFVLLFISCALKLWQENDI